MKKTWKELILEIVGLGFENEEFLVPRKKTVITAINRALTIISASFKAKVCVLEGVCPDKNGFIEKPALNFLRYCSLALSDNENNPVSFKILPDNRIYTDVKTPVNLWYEASYDKIPEDISDTDEIELDEQVFCLLPLLACFYIWLDDDERKAITYRNDYESIKNEFLQNDGKAYISGGKNI